MAQPGPCEECGGTTEWLPIPDSLAWACKGCCAVQVGSLGGEFTKGKSLVEWAQDVTEAKNARKRGKD